MRLRAVFGPVNLDELPLAHWQPLPSGIVRHQSTAPDRHDARAERASSAAAAASVSPEAPESKMAAAVCCSECSAFERLCPRGCHRSRLPSPSQRFLVEFAEGGIGKLVAELDDGGHLVARDARL